MQEESLAEQLLKIIDDIKLEEIGIRYKLEREVERYNKFQYVISNSNEQKKIKKPAARKIDIKEYAKYILREGHIIEKRELLGSLKSKLVLTDKILTLQK